jgi:hypothetical protein
MFAQCTHCRFIKKLLSSWQADCVLLLIRNCPVRYLQLLCCRGSILSVQMLLGIDFITFFKWYSGWTSCWRDDVSLNVSSGIFDPLYNASIGWSGPCAMLPLVEVPLGQWTPLSKGYSITVFVFGTKRSGMVQSGTNCHGVRVAYSRWSVHVLPLAEHALPLLREQDLFAKQNSTVKNGSKFCLLFDFGPLHCKSYKLKLINK